MWILVVKFGVLILLTTCSSLKGEENVTWPSGKPSIRADCPDGWFKCSNGKCIAGFWVCDGSNDCGNLDDEKDCDGKIEIPSSCLSSQFKCVSDNLCIPEKWHCDGDVDCNDRSDETNCGNVTTCTGFRCHDGHCVPLKWQCDRQKDCDDGSDEELCEYGPQCLDSEFVCSSGSCLNRSLVCNGKNDCRDGSDEGPHCADHCENNTCAQHCKSTPSGPQCYCDDGFALDDKNNKTCTDINECQEDGFCSHTCVNTRGSYKCICNPGYELVNRTCRATGPDPLLIFSMIKEVRGMKLRSKQYFPIRNAESKATALDVDPYTEKIYWIDISNKSTIYSSNLDGRELKTVLSHGLLVPEDIAVDYLTHNVYLTDSGLKQVLACRMDGKMCHVLHDTNIERPRSIVLDIKNGLMYWSDWGDKSAGIYRSGMDGSGRIAVVSNRTGGAIGWPNGIALDPSTNRLYWADVKLSTIEFITLDHLRTRKVIMNSSVFHPYSLAVFEDTIYWSDWYSLSLESCNKFTGHKVTIIARENKQHIMGVHVYHPVLAAPEVSNPCWSNGCSHMCLLSWGREFTCACPHGYKLLGDRKTCSLESHGADIFVSEGSTIFQTRPNSVGSDAMTELRLNLGNVVINRVVFDSRSRNLFVISIYKPAIYAYNMDTQRIQELARNHVVSPVDIAFDWTSNNLYWIDGSKGTAEVVNIILRKTVTLLTNLQPVALAISPNNGHMFIASTVSFHSVVVNMHAMDGKKLRTLQSVQGTPIALALHPSKSLLYWADPKAGTISYVNYTTSRSARIIKTRIDSVMSLAVSEEAIYYTAKKRELNIHKGNLTFVIQLPGEKDISGPRRVFYSPGTPPGLSPALCLIKNGGCSYVCLTSPSGKTCACSSDKILSGDNVTCVEKPCNETDFKCMNGQCLKSEKKCDGIADCEDGSDEIDCLSRCPVNDFQCKNGKCILNSWHCDHRNDCGDNSDESDCPETKNCTKDQVRCLNGECVSVLWRCDGEPDCSDGTDESYCNSTGCSDNHVRCDNGQCVPKSWVCDGTDDCKDKSDEKNCSKKAKPCTIHEFRCESDGSCIDEILRCDGRVECDDKSDEKNCPQRRHDCKEGMFLCKDKSCLYDYEVCDGHEDCSQKEDEFNCTHTVCQPEEIMCTTSQKCISRLWICDGDADCPGGTDEERCVEVSTPLPTLPPVTEDCNDFYCPSSDQCLPWSMVCNGHLDCEGLPDEGGLCTRSCGSDNGGCSHKCKKTPHGSKCMCNEGYRLLQDNKTCDDIDECHSPGACSHMCVNTRGSYKCHCADGYYLHDHRSCKVEGGPAVLMYLLGDQIHGLDLSSNRTKVYFNGKRSDMIGMDYDIADGTFYWTELYDGSINRFSTKNNTQEVIFKSPDRPEVIKYDWIAKNLYYLDKHSNIGVCTRDGNFCKIIVTLKETLLDSLAIAPSHGFMFWTIWADPHRHQYSGLIERAEMDGNHKTGIVSVNTKSPTGLAVDHILQMIYWSDTRLNTLECVDFHGFNRKLIVRSDAYHPFAVAVFEDNVYWADWGSYRIMKCHKYLDGYCEKASGNNIKTKVLLAVHDVMQPIVPNSCQNSKCQHMCVLTKSSHVCMCEDSEVKDGSCVTSHEIKTLPATERTLPTYNPGPSQFSMINISKTLPPASRPTYNPGPSQFSVTNISTTLPPASNPTSSSKHSHQCPEDYCHEGAECEAKDEVYICKCPSPYSGERCETKVAASHSSYDYYWVIAVLFSIAVTGVIILLIFLCIRHRDKLQRVSENVSVKFRNQKSSRDGRLVMDMDDGNHCEELILGQEVGYKQSLGSSEYSHENSEEGNFKKWPSFTPDSLRIGDSIVNFFQNLKRNSSIL